MKNIILFFIFFFILTLFPINSGKTQPVTGQTLASKVLDYDAGGLIGQSAEVLGPLSDSATRAGGYGVHQLVHFEGVYYLIASSQKYETGIEKNVFLKVTTE